MLLKDIFYTLFVIILNLVFAGVFMSLGFIFFRMIFKFMSYFFLRFCTRVRHRIHPRLQPRIVDRQEEETSECKECEIIGPEYTSSRLSDVEYSKIEEKSCSICLGIMTTDDTERLRCGHVYHEECLSTWMNLKNHCPTCRSKGCCVRIV